MRLLWKVFLGTLAIVAITTVLVERQVSAIVEARRLEDTEQRIRDDTLLLRELAEPLLLSGDVGALRALVERLQADLPDRRMTLLDAGGVVLADSHHDPLTMEFHDDRPEIRDPGSVHWRDSATLDQAMVYTALPVQGDSGETVGFVRISLGAADILADVDDVQRAITTGALAGGFVGLILAFVLARRVSRPLGQIGDMVAALGRGEDERRLPLMGSGEVGQLALAMNDLADRLVFRAAEVRRLEQVRTDFVANVSHELKTPLTSVTGFLDAVTDDPDMEPEWRSKFLDKAVRHAHRLSDIVNDLLALARIEAQQGSRPTDRLDLGDIVRECARDARAQGEDLLVAVVEELPEEPLVVVGREEALSTAIDNLLTNAIKYSREGSTVVIRLEARDGWASIEVQDHGRGIPREEQERIFERFYRVDKDRTQSLGGTGLGLSIVRNVARNHGGDVAVQSRPGVGSTFELRLPLADG